MIKLIKFWDDLNHHADSPNCESEQYGGNELHCQRCALLSVLILIMQEAHEFWSTLYESRFYSESFIVNRSSYEIFLNWSNLKEEFYTHHPCIM